MNTDNALLEQINAKLGKILELYEALVAEQRQKLYLDDACSYCKTWVRADYLPTQYADKHWRRGWSQRCPQCGKEYLPPNARIE